MVKLVFGDSSSAKPDSRGIAKAGISKVRAWLHRKDDEVPLQASNCISPKQQKAILDAEKNVIDCARNTKSFRVSTGTSIESVDRSWASEHPFASDFLDFIGPPEGMEGWKVKVLVETENYKTIEEKNTKLGVARAKFFETVELVITEVVQTHGHLAGLKANREDSIDKWSLKVEGNLLNGEHFKFVYSLPKSPPFENTPIMYHEYSLAIGQKKEGPYSFRHAEILVFQIEQTFFQLCLQK